MKPKTSKLTLAEAKRLQELIFRRTGGKKLEKENAKEKPMFNNESISRLARAISALTAQKETEFEWFKSRHGLVTKQDLKESIEKIMSAISDYAAKQKAFNDRQEKAVDSLVTSESAITADIAELNRLIKQLQDSPGGITPEDQATLNELEARGQALADRSEKVAEAMAALDALTPPVVPPIPA